ncbi:hypothetical protein GEMRC1_005951 [Eukaryota sp. GEM-RC1]
MSNGDELSILPLSPHPPSKRVHVQQSLLILVHLHLLRLKRTLQQYPFGTISQLDGLKTALPAFFGQVGYVSNHFLDSSFQAAKVFFKYTPFMLILNTFPN